MAIQAQKKKAIGFMREDLLDEIDARAQVLGQTRRVWVERACERILADETGDAPLIPEARSWNAAVAHPPHPVPSARAGK